MSTSPVLMCLLANPVVVALTVCYGVAVAVFHVCAIRFGAKATLISKSIASLFFVIIGSVVLFTLLATKDNAAVMGSGMYLLIFLGLMHGCIGDVLLACRKIFPEKRTKWIASGMVAFALGHIYYAIAAFEYLNSTVNTLETPLKMMLLIAPFVLSAAIDFGNIKLATRLNLAYGKLKIGVIIYSFIIAFLLFSTLVGSLTAFAFTNDTITLLPILPITLFTISDFVLSTNYFDKERRPMTPKQIIVIHVTYYMAQLMFALALSSPRLTCMASSL